MSTQTKVTVITATYNNFDNLFDTIKSVFNQDYANIEYIITDDGSLQFPKAEIEDYLCSFARHDIKYKIINHSENIGTVKNLNNAFMIADGTILMNLSCGDIFYDCNTISKIVSCFDKTDKKVVVTRRAVYNGSSTSKIVDLIPHSREIEKINKWNQLEQYSHFLSSRDYDMASGSAMYFDRSIFEELGFYDERYRLWEDGPFLQKYLWNYSLETRYDIISIYYKTGGISTSNTVNPIYYADYCQFVLNEKKTHYHSLGKKLQRNIDYSKDRILANTRFKKMIVYIKYFDQVAELILYLIIRRINMAFDRSEVNNINNQK